jgi:acetylornithine/succinyldiaminopimelate/putrescine aminotransferase
VKPAPEETKQIMDYCYKHGLIALTAGSYSNVVRLLVPLVISDEQMDEGPGCARSSAVFCSRETNGNTSASFLKNFSDNSA